MLCTWIGSIVNSIALLRLLVKPPAIKDSIMMFCANSRGSFQYLKEIFLWLRRLLNIALVESGILFGEGILRKLKAGLDQVFLTRQMDPPGTIPGD
jgi:hypothetical protein